MAFSHCLRRSIMKLLVCLTLLSALCATVGATVCKHCTDPNDPECTLVEDIICPWGKMCVTASVIVESPEHSIMRIYKDCVGRSLCPSPGERTISSNVGNEYSLANVKCCNSRKCNDQTLPFPEASEHMLNRRFCPGCNNSDPLCTSMVECRGHEDTCFTAEVLKLGEVSKVYGCGSDNVCDASQKLDSLPFLEKLGTVSETPTCTDAPPAQTRRCLQCDNSTDLACTSFSEVDCDADTDKCFTATYSDGQISRGCGPPSLCSAEGNMFFSVDIGSSTSLANTQCCRGDSCNTDTLTVPVDGQPNTLACDVCLPNTSFCFFQVPCEGEETRCFSTFGSFGGNPVPVGGCTTETVCDAPGSLDLILFSNIKLTQPLSCCNFTGCNSPDRATTITTTTNSPTSTISPSSTPFVFPDMSDVGGDQNAVVVQQMLFLVQQLLLYLQQLQLYLLQCPADQQLLLQPLLLLCQQLLIYVQLLLQQQVTW